MHNIQHIIDAVRKRMRNIQREERTAFGLHIVGRVRRMHSSPMFAEYTLATSDWELKPTGGGLLRVEWNPSIGFASWKLVEPNQCLSFLSYRYNRHGD
jgi:hypothetical protein